MFEVSDDGSVCSLGALEGATLPVATEIYLRLTTEASSDKPSGATVSAVVIAPVLLNGVPALNAGAQLTGNTADAAAAQGSDGRGRGKTRDATHSVHENCRCEWAFAAAQLRIDLG